MILHWLDQQTCSSWTFASLLLYFWTRLYLGALFSAAGHWSIQNKQLGVTVDSSVDLVFCFWRIHKGNFLIVALALMVTSKIANTIKITPKMSDFLLLGGLTYTNSHYPFFFFALSSELITSINPVFISLESRRCSFQGQYPDLIVLLHRCRTVFPPRDSEYNFIFTAATWWERKEEGNPPWRPNLPSHKGRPKLQFITYSTLVSSCKSPYCKKVTSLLYKLWAAVVVRSRYDRYLEVTLFQPAGDYNANLTTTVKPLNG